MSSKDWKSPNWRDDPALSNFVVYKKKLALRPVICSNGEKVWFKYYYSKYRIWGHMPADSFSKRDYSHIDFIENITEAEYIVRKLAENL